MTSGDVEDRLNDGVVSFEISRRDRGDSSKKQNENFCFFLIDVTHTSNVCC
jgi:hypothetical protein